MASKTPRYLETFRNGELQAKASIASERLSNCSLCPRRCEVDRTRNQYGRCSTGHRAKVASFDAHFGEEDPLVGDRGSGTIFFSHCNLLCNFCQNYDISHKGFGHEVSAAQLADMMLSLQAAGCHNINFVTPSHVVPQILSALLLAADHGLAIPLVYNSSGYDSVETLQLLDGVVDIYMPDFKFWNTEISDLTCQAADYPEIARQAIIEMHRQVGDLTMNRNGLAIRGLLVRHLILPQNLADTAKVMAFIATRVSPNTYVNLMAQYRPCGKASEFKGLNQSITDQAYQNALKAAEDAGIKRLDNRRPKFILF